MLRIRKLTTEEKQRFNIIESSGVADYDAAIDDELIQCGLIYIITRQSKIRDGSKTTVGVCKNAYKENFLKLFLNEEIVD